MRGWLNYCRIGLIISFALIVPCRILAQDFSTVPDFPSDFTLIDPESATPSPTPSPTPARTTQTTQKVADTPTGPAALPVVTFAAILGLILLAGIRYYQLTARR